MNACDLEQLFQEWRTATEAEGKAIRCDDWEAVFAEQRHKEDLKSRIVRSTDEWQKQWPQTGETQQDYERRFRPLVTELISLESSNEQLLADRKEQVRRELAETNRSASRLRGVHRAYGSSADTNWASYS